MICTVATTLLPSLSSNTMPHINPVVGGGGAGKGGVGAGSVGAGGIGAGGIGASIGGTGMGGVGAGGVGAGSGPGPGVGSGPGVGVGVGVGADSGGGVTSTGAGAGDASDAAAGPVGLVSTPVHPAQIAAVSRPPAVTVHEERRNARATMTLFQRDVAADCISADIND
jgi:hypothetical protein